MKGEGYAELAALLARVGTLWRAVTALRLWTRAAAGAAVALGLALSVHWLFQPGGAALVALWAAAAALVSAALISAIASVRRPPGHRQLARFIEEQCPELEDTLVTAVAQDASAAPSMSALVVDDAVRRARQVDPDRVISRRTVRAAAMLALAASIAFATLGTVSVPPAAQAAKVARVYLFPESLDLRVTPGSVKVRAGESLRIIATLSGHDVVVPKLRVSVGDEWREAEMEKVAEGFAYTFEAVEQDFRYGVAAAGTSSAEYAVTVLRPPRVERIDLRYEFPAELGMPPRDEEDGGDIYGPAGTRVRVSVHADKPVREAALTLAGGKAITLSMRDGVFQGELTITEDGSYRVALGDADGLTNPGDTEYFIRTLQDRPPDVRIVRPASDRQVTPLEEVAIESRADDDVGIVALDLVYTAAAEPNGSCPSLAPARAPP